MSSEPIPAQPVALKITPPSQGPLRRHTHTYDLMRQCIHCGFCLPTCPTYSVLGVEMDSPRGRIYQMQAVAEGRLEITDDFVEHMYCCVGCRACETACPSGVQFGKLIEAAREQIQIAEKEGGIRPGRDDQQDNGATPQAVTDSTAATDKLAKKLLRRFFFDLMLPSRPVLSLVFGGLKLYQRSGLQTVVRRSGLLDVVNALPTPFQGKLKLPEQLMDAATGPIIPAHLPEITPAIGQKRYRVGFISGCIMDQIFHDINEATIRVLAANGCEVITPVQQNCCGALHVHAGEAESGKALARHNIDVFEQYNFDAIIINSAGCGSTLKEYGHLLRDDPAYASRAEAFSAKVKDISEFLVGLDWSHGMGPLARKVAYHDACHLAHGQKIKQQPRQLLKAIPGLALVDLKEADWCCGSAGIYNITNQDMANELLERKMNNIVATGANTIATGNPGCMMQIALGARERGMDLEVMHPVQLLDEAYRAGGLYNLPEPISVEAGKQKYTLLLGIGIGVLIGAFLLRRRRRS
ncbi:4Fe-4S dicluster domain-containing protein [Ktedonosporobacter rubrisoli]|uniref:4Fe-4S dicluster domain-containing protein n=1 Tax=Ktedonosporobacter rubrisoli TaxID=2509675 RepID=A0A4P6JRY2_KTERU|nr:heterodisulfide reductase-related iron-sulfur binding cluster [Ktedonosporobacter rubrisoli]QBD78239.1 4Fe-4S dicluster domain-containing protein [Ktedonosporobacter rubrisoli]